MSSSRVHYIDCLRVFACFLVVAVHCNFMPDNPKDHIWAQILGVLGSPSSELFLAISGSLLIPVKTPQSFFYKRRFAKLFPPLFFWSLVGIAFYVLTGQRRKSEIGLMLVSLPFKSAIIPPFWFMYAIIGMYLLAPILTPYINQTGKSGVRFLLALWAVTLILPLGNLFFDGFYNVEGDYTYMLSAFSGYPGYMILGYYLRKFPLKITEHRYGWLFIIIGWLFMMSIVAFVGFRFPQHRDYVLGNLSFVNALIVILLFSLFQALFKDDTFLTRVAQNLTQYTFGIYLLHVFVVYFVHRVIAPLSFPVPVRMLSVILLSFIVSLTITWLLCKSRFTKWSVQGINYAKSA